MLIFSGNTKIKISTAEIERMRKGMERMFNGNYGL
jgi:hypothetical protein